MWTSSIITVPLRVRTSPVVSSKVSLFASSVPLLAYLHLHTILVLRFPAHDSLFRPKNVHPTLRCTHQREPSSPKRIRSTTISTWHVNVCYDEGEEKNDWEHAALVCVT